MHFDWGTIALHFVAVASLLLGVFRAGYGAAANSTARVIHGCMWVGIGFAFLRFANL